MNSYIYRVAIEPAGDGDGVEFVGRCAEFPLLSWRAKTYADATHGIKIMVRSALAATRTPPLPVCERDYNGSIQLDLPPQIHRRLAIEAATGGITLSQLIRLKIELGEKFTVE